jgi:hypothetical protein
MSRLVSRDSFARQELHVERVYRPAVTCTWCGGIRIIAQSGVNWLYRFWVETDEGQKYIDEQLFCSRDCRNCYFG